MALIPCKFCGKSISESATKCPHCGRSPNEEKNNAENPISFANLSLKEQEKLNEEFFKAYPSHKDLLRKIDKCANIKKIFDVVSWLGLGLIVFFVIMMIISDNAIWSLIMLVISFVIQAIGDIGEIVVSFIVARFRKKANGTEKIKQHWLRNEKNVIYHPKAN